MDRPDAHADSILLLDTGAELSAATCIQGDAWVGVLRDQDWDHDGWAIADGDCDDCDANANPGALDVPGNDVDEDCSGTVDDEPAGCDAGLELSSNDALDAAKAIGLCRFSLPRERTWGVLSARYELADGTHGMHYASHGILPGFGLHVRPQEGSSMLGLSSATARNPTDPAYQSPEEANMKTSCQAPAGWPRESPSCPDAPSLTTFANDSASLVLRVRTPTNAHALSFRFAFYTAEFPMWICNQYNDFFVALLDSQAPNPGAQDRNISFDELGNPISVNSAFLEACAPQVAGGRPFACPLGNELLVGTGFDANGEQPLGHAATGWLKTVASVLPGEEIELRFAIWDGGDHLRGSTVLLDSWQWDAQPAQKPITERIGAPK